MKPLLAAVRWSLVLACSTAISQAQGIAWEKSFASAQSKAAKSKRLILLELFKTESRAHALLQKTFADPKVVAASRAYVPIQLDVASKDGKFVLSMINVKQFPVTFFLTSNGQIRGWVGGACGPRRMESQLKAVAKHDANFNAYLATVAKKPKDVRALAGLAFCYAGRGDLENTMHFIGRANGVDPANTTGLLTEAYLATGDFLQFKGESQFAMLYFSKAKFSTQSPGPRAYAMMSLAACYLTQRKQEEKAARELEQALAIPGIWPEDRVAIQTMLSQIKKR